VARQGDLQKEKRNPLHHKTLRHSAMPEKPIDFGWVANGSPADIMQTALTQSIRGPLTERRTAGARREKIRRKNLRRPLLAVDTPEKDW
jgi:hypothetical protein